MLISKLDVHSSLVGNIGLYSYATAFFAYITLVILAVISRRKNPVGNALIIASALTVLWAGVITLSTILKTPGPIFIQLSEAARNGAWIYVLLKLLSVRLQGTDHVLATTRWLPWYLVSFTTVLTILLSSEILSRLVPSLFNISLYASYGGWLAMSIVGLLLLEQYYRNSNGKELRATRHLSLGLGILFAFDFFMYSEGLLFRYLDYNVWQARGLVTTMAAILIAVSISRSNTNEIQDNEQGFHLSRHFAFHALTLMASGIYLITMALAAYFIRYLGGSWGGVLQIAFLCAAGLTLIVLLFSGQIRARSRVWLSKNFFSYKYDYRLEWLEFTNILANGDNNIPDNITRAIANLAKSPAGILWSRNEDGRFSIATNWQMPSPGTDVDLIELSQWLQINEWIIDIREWRQAPDMYQNLELPTVITAIPNAWLIIPLLFGERLQGILLLQQSDILRDLNWEDRDLLKVAGKQAASHLAQYQADQALVESRQFEAFNRLSAYVIHDLKNILAQLSLMVANANKHKHNPEFIDDMVDTVSNTVDRMSKLMAQLRGATVHTPQQEFELSELLTSVVSGAHLRKPHPELTLFDGQSTLSCDRDGLRTVFEHLIQNAQEATNEEGYVKVRQTGAPGFAIVEIEDSGIGMDELFIRHRLFRPFDSTKGLTGMGIGAFESRDFIHSLGGELSVESTPGHGSLFRVRIPCDTDVDTERANSLHEESVR